LDRIVDNYANYEMQPKKNAVIIGPNIRNLHKINAHMMFE